MQLKSWCSYRLCKHVAGVFYQLVEHRELFTICTPHEKASKDVLQSWHAPIEAPIDQPVRLSDLRFTKQDIRKDINGSRKRNLQQEVENIVQLPYLLMKPEGISYKNFVIIFIH